MRILIYLSNSKKHIPNKLKNKNYGISKDDLKSNLTTIIKR